MAERITLIIGVIATLLVLSSAAFAQVTVTVDRNLGPAGTKDFKFKLVKPPLKDDVGAKAEVKVLFGSGDPNNAGIAALTDGVLPAKEDDAANNFAFEAGSAGGLFRFDLGSAVDIQKINSYSWHNGSHAPQVYMLYASDGSEPQFCAEPVAGLDPSSCGWRLITSVDTRRGRGDGGGQYVVSVAEARGSLGKYRYLLFRCAASETDDDEGNTYFSEIDIIVKKQS